MDAITQSIVDSHVDYLTHYSFEDVEIDVNERGNVYVTACLCQNGGRAWLTVDHHGKAWDWDFDGYPTPDDACPQEIDHIREDNKELGKRMYDSMFTCLSKVASKVKKEVDRLEELTT